MRIGADEASRIASVEIGEVAPAAAGDENFRARLGVMLKHKHAPPAPACMHRAIEPGSACADDDGIETLHGSACHLRSNCTQAPFSP